MRKSFIFATMAAAALFAGCSSSDDLASNPGEVGIPTEAENVAIEIGVGSPTSTMRGTGAVGGVSEYDENTGFGTAVTPTYWAGQKINVYMLNKGTMDIAQFVKANDPTHPEDIYNNAVLTTPSYTDDPSTKTATGIAKYIDEAAGVYQGLPFIKYYPSTGQFDFWGYRIDDAVKEADPVVGENDIKVTFTVDGTQDVLAAQTIETFADLSDARKAAIVGGEDTFVATTTAGTRYSASAARKGIQPELLFKHMMTRLTFQAKAGTPSIAADVADEDNPVPAANPVYVTGISVRPVKTVGATIAENEYVSTKGTLTIAWKPGSEPTAENPQMAWGDAEDGETALVLKKRPDAADTGEKIENSKLVDIVDPNNTDYTTNGAVGLKYKSNGATDAEKFVKTPIGESIIAPDAQAYEVTINLAQKLPQHETAGSTLTPGQIEADMTEMAYNTVKVVVRPSTTEPFLPGYSYNLLCTVYGLERIDITATLEPWKQGEQIEVIGE
ncbi:MAG: hypothetical protein J6E48_06950 [Prevotella sp.]|nr:hypothetical protein [Prevotella sp.]